MSTTHGTAGRSRRRVAMHGVLVNTNVNVATTGTADEVLYTYNIPKGTLDVNGMALRILFGWTSTTGNSKTPNIKLNGTSIGAQVTTAVAGMIGAIIRRTAAGTYAYTTLAQQSGAANSIGSSTGAVAIPAGGNWDTTTVALTFTAATPSAAGECAIQSVVIELLPETPSPTDT